MSLIPLNIDVPISVKEKCMGQIKSDTRSKTLGNFN